MTCLHSFVKQHNEIHDHSGVLCVSAVKAVFYIIGFASFDSRTSTTVPNPVKNAAFTVAPG